MRHHSYNPNFKFVVEPVNFNKLTDRNILQYCLGATLYMPGTKEILEKILNKEFNDITSIVMCFEDAIQEDDVQKAENNVLNHLSKIDEAIQENKLSIDDIPLIFLRVRNPNQFKVFATRLTQVHTRTLSGFVFPKFYSSNANEYFEQLEDICNEHNAVLYGMPILEGKDHCIQRNQE